jgi:hypothetical protein
MPAVRSLASQIAHLLGGPASDGWAFSQMLIRAGICERGKGGRGGAGAPAAQTRHAVLLLLTMASDAPPRSAMSRAIEIAACPFAQQELLTFFPGAGITTVDFPDAPKFFGTKTFGDVASSAINDYRAGLDCLPSKLRFGVRGVAIFGSLDGESVPLGDGRVSTVSTSFSRPLDVQHGARFIPQHATELDAAILWEIVKLLGPIAASGGGGDAVPFTHGLGEDELGDDEAAPLAAFPVDDKGAGKWAY